MNDSLNWAFLKQGDANWNALKRELLGEIEPTEASNKDWQMNQILSQHVWPMLDENHSHASPARKGGAVGYGEDFFRKHQQIHAQIKRLVDQVNIEMYL